MCRTCDVGTASEMANKASPACSAHHAARIRGMMRASEGSQRARRHRQARSDHGRAHTPLAILREVRALCRRCPRRRREEPVRRRASRRSHRRFSNPSARRRRDGESSSQQLITAFTINKPFLKNRLCLSTNRRLTMTRFVHESRRSAKKSFSVQTDFC